MPILPNFTSKYSHNWKIDFTQCAPNGFLKYTELCDILQLTAAYHAEMGGISFADMQVFNQAWVLSRMRIEIDKMPHWKDEITVKTWIISLENSRSVRALEVYSGEKKIIGCETFWAVINTKMRRPETLALPFQHFELFPDDFSTIERIKKINNSIEILKVKKRQIVLSDLDIVNHVNNVKYLEWCLDIVAVDKILNQNIKSFDMNFKNELLLNDEVSIGNAITSDNQFFSISKNDKNCFSMIVSW
ncbi:MAG: acyl-[acyl-carrier-protein] thioesterase [Flavobacterium sp.]|nr:acyl-[acyl-carrier-protein] thioesterase [Flavobacterium sp.]